MPGAAVNPPIITARLRKRVIETFPLRRRSIHGPAHWDRVLENGLHLAAETGADPRVVALFALFHDSRRQNDIVDGGHGRRGAEYALELWRQGWFELDDAAFELLAEACIHHTEGGLEGDATIVTCWDADRLDLWRCGIRPDPTRLCTVAARRPETIEWAMGRSGGPAPRGG